MKKTILLTIIFASSLLFGCTTVDEKESYNKSFVGKAKAELFKALGEPKYSFDTTFDDEHASRTFVYATTDPKRSCVESFKIESQSGIILSYNCR